MLPAANLHVLYTLLRLLAVVLTGTPADKLLAMMTELMDGGLPNLQDILLIQSTILESRDIYQPFRLGKQLLEAKELEVRAETLTDRVLCWRGHNGISWVCLQCSGVSCRVAATVVYRIACFCSI